jgi:hypothetical protein
MSDPHGTPFSTERELAEDEVDRDPAASAPSSAPSPADKAPPANPPVDDEAMRKGLETLDRVKPY